jgi:calcium-dependent protein kinase
MESFNSGTLVGENKKYITDDYVISQRLGKGAYSEVFLVKQKISGLQRCVKVTHKRNFVSPDDESIFEEVRILSKLDHPNIMKVYEYYQDTNYVYVVSEYLSGGELFYRIVASKGFSEGTAARYMQQILSAVSYLHKNGIIHRDLKPENIVFESTDPNSNLKIIDFGTSRKVKVNEKLNVKLGTVYYIAPEVLKNDYDIKCDVWSCGVILYVLLCGYAPFDSPNDEDIYKKILKGQFEFPSKKLVISVKRCQRSHYEDAQIRRP